MGAWIETIDIQPLPNRPTVAPFMGAWIETVRNVVQNEKSRSLPSWERGLKPKDQTIFEADVRRSLHGSVD